MTVRADAYWGGRYRLNPHALRAIRRLQGKTQVSLAAEAGTHDSFISRLERGERQGCTRDLLEKLAFALDVPASALIAASLDE